MTEYNNPFTEIINRLIAIENKLSELAPKEKPKENKYYPIKEAAQKLGVASITVYRAVEAKKIPAKRIGSRLMVPASFIDTV